jgi:hypothetical protein
LAQDVTFAFRVLSKSRGFSIAVVASLGLGIGVNAAVFTLMDAVLWRMLPVKDPKGLLVAGWQEGGAAYTGFTYAEYLAMREADPVADLAGYATAPVNIGSTALLSRARTVISSPGATSPCSA